MNLLIVDDEPLIHVSIEYSLKETDNADELQIFHANNGFEMIRIMEEAVMDIVFVDVQMPGMDGLSAIREARKNWPKTSYYIMSGFSEFEYAREAVRLEVIDYLLKPLDSHQLSEIIERKRSENLQRQKQRTNNFRAWLVGTLHKHDVTSLYNTGYYSAILLFCCDSQIQEGESIIPVSFQNPPTENLSIPCWEGNLMLLFNEDKNRLKIILETFPQWVPNEITCIISPVSNDPQFLAETLHRMLDLSPVRVFRGIGHRYSLLQFTGFPQTDIDAGKNWIELRNYYFEKHYTEFTTASSQLILTLAGQPEYHCRRLASFLHVVTGIRINEPYNENAIRQCLNTAAENILQQENGSERIDDVIEFIKINYCKDITIASISTQFDLTPNYLSTLFKKKMGVNFIDYLISLRIAEAKRLLISSSK